MSAFHPNLDKVLYGELQPWLQDNVPDESYTPKISSIRLQENAVQLKYELSFPRPFNSKTKYYRRLIENAIEATVQNSISLMKEDEDEEILLCYTDEFLYKNLKTKLLDISENILDLGSTGIDILVDRFEYLLSFVVLLKYSYISILLKNHSLEYLYFSNFLCNKFSSLIPPSITANNIVSGLLVCREDSLPSKLSVYPILKKSLFCIKYIILCLQIIFYT